MLAFAANSVLTRLALADRLLGPTEFAMIRVVSGAAMLAVFVLWRDRKLMDLSEVSALSVTALSVYVLGFSYAYVTLETGTGALILFGGVQITMFAGALILRESMSLFRWLGAGIAIAGLVFLLAPSSASAPDPFGAALMAAAAMGWGYYSIYGRKVSRPLQATAGNFLLSAPVAVVIGLAVGATIETTARGVLLAVISGAITSGLGYALWYWVLLRIELSVAAIAQLTVPAIAFLSGVFFLGEELNLRAVIASLLILGGVGISIRR